jgi:hypothetical protein
MNTYFSLAPLNIRMRSLLSILFCLTLVSFSLACGQNANEESLRIADFGIYGADRENPELLSETDKIPATVGTVFGVRMMLDGETTASLSFRWTFPAMQNPANGQIWTEMTGTQELSSDRAHSFLARINNDWEAVPGDWTLQVLRGEQVVAEKVFHVFVPLAVSD